MQMVAYLIFLVKNVTVAERKEHQIVSQAIRVLVPSP